MKLDARIQELIAVGASVTANCQPCLQYHSAQALENGAGADEVADAVEVGRTVRKGAAAKFDKLAAGTAAAGTAGAAPAGPGVFSGLSSRGPGACCG